MDDIFKSFQESVNRTASPNLEQKDKVLNAILGISGESGEIVELIKKHYYHNIPLDLNKLQKELGDLMFYIQWLHNIYNMSLPITMLLNKTKLETRYPNGFVEGGGKRED